VERTKLQFILVGFKEDTGSRVFVFDGVAGDRTRSHFTVRADLAMSRRYGIRLQELPLLCREILERCPDGETRRAFTYTEADMREFADGRESAREAALLRKKAPRRPAGDQAGSGWRTSIR
jgi:hypothetical protein